MVELSQEKLEARMHQIEQIAEEYNIEDIDKLVEQVKEKYKEKSEALEAKGKKLPEVRIFNKALGEVCTDLGSFQGERFQILILGYTRPRDWNAEEREDILKAWAGGPKARDNLIKSKKVMQMMKQGKMVIVSRVDKGQNTKSGDYIVLSGKELEEGEEPIPRDTRKTLADGKTPNRSFGRPLTSRWGINMFGLARVNDVFKQFKAAIYHNAYANPYHENFLPSLAPAFGTFNAILSVHEDKSTEDKLFFQYLSAIEPIKNEESSTEEILYQLLDGGLIQSFKVKNGAIENFETPFLVDLDDIKDYHDQVSALKDDKGEVIKSPSGYGKTHWDRVGIGIWHLFAMTETKNENYALRFRDWTNKVITGFTDELTQHLKINPNSLPKEVMVSFRTFKKKTRYDRENKVNIDDPINGDVVLGNIMGLSFTDDILEGE